MIDLNEILNREDFKQELARAAEISFKNRLESYFLVYFNGEEIKVNQAVKGCKELSILSREKIDSEITDKDYYYYCPSENNAAGITSKKGKGVYIELDSYSLLNVHFHPPNTTIIPSYSDFRASNLSRIVNQRLALFNGKIRYINPISIVGCCLGNQDNFQLFCYQEKTKKPVDYDKFDLLLCRMLNKRANEKLEAFDFRINSVDIKHYFSSPLDFLEFFRSSKRYNLMIIKGNDFSDLIGSDIFQDDLIKRANLN